MDSIKALAKLRGYLDEPIPEGGTEKDTRFSDEKLLELIVENESLYLAASRGWTLKASMIAREIGTVDEYSAGNERYKSTNLTTAVNAALTMAKEFAKMHSDEVNAGTSGFILKFRTPDVM